MEKYKGERCVGGGNGGDESNMAPDSDETIRAKVLSTMDRKGWYCPKHARIDTVADLSVASHDEDQAQFLIHEMARADEEPIRYSVPNETVCLEVDSQRWTAARIGYWDAEQLEWSQRKRLG